MIYNVVKFLLRITLPIFYKKIQFKNLENLPVDQPVIIASNHPNAFMDGMIIGTFAKQKVYILVRSDVFNSPFKRWFFGKIGLAPIYRIQEGKENLHKNEETFRVCGDRLALNESIIVFPEGICIQERRLRPLKKGAARIVFNAATAGQLKKELIVLPIGLNYERPHQFRSRLFVNIGEPIKVSGFLEMYEKDKVYAVNEFTRILQEKITPLLIHIDNKTNDRLVEDIEEIYRTQLIQSKGLNVENVEDRYLASKEIARVINHSYINNHEQVEMLKQKVYHYIKQLQELKLRDHLLKKQSIESLTFSNLLSAIFLLFLCFPIHFCGLLINYIPYSLAYGIANKKVRAVEFHSSVNAVLGMFLFILFYLLYVTLFILFAPNVFYTVVFMLFIPLMVQYNLFFWPQLKKMQGRMRLRRLLNRNKRKVVSLIRQRKEIISEFERMIGEAIPIAI